MHEALRGESLLTMNDVGSEERGGKEDPKGFFVALDPLSSLALKGPGKETFPFFTQVPWQFGRQRPIVHSGCQRLLRLSATKITRSSVLNPRKSAAELTRQSWRLQLKPSISPLPLDIRYRYKPCFSRSSCSERETRSKGAHLVDGEDVGHSSRSSHASHSWPKEATTIEARWGRRTFG